MHEALTVRRAWVGSQTKAAQRAVFFSNDTPLRAVTAPRLKAVTSAPAALRHAEQQQASPES